MRISLSLFAVLFVVATSVAAEDKPLPGWLPVDGEMTQEAYDKATTRNLKLIKDYATRFLTSSGVSNEALAGVGVTARLISGEEVTLYRSEGFSVNVDDVMDSEQSISLYYSFGW